MDILSKVIFIASLSVAALAFQSTIASETVGNIQTSEMADRGGHHGGGHHGDGHHGDWGGHRNWSGWSGGYYSQPYYYYTPSSSDYYYSDPYYYNYPYYYNNYNDGGFSIRLGF